MATDLIELTADIVIAHASVTEISPEDLLGEIKAVYATLEQLQRGEKGWLEATPGDPKGAPRKGRAAAEPAADHPPAEPALSIEEAFRPDQVGCMICGKHGMKTLKRHLATAHALKPGQYRKRFQIPRDTPLAAEEYVEKRRRIAVEKGLGEKLAQARALKKNKPTAE